MSRVKRRHAGNLVLRRADAKLGIDLLSDTLGEIGSGNLVDGNDDDATQQASEESDDPFRAILAPDQDLVAFADSSMFQFARETIGVAQHLAVSPALRPIAATMNVGDLARMAAKIVQVIQDRGARHS